MKKSTTFLLRLFKYVTGLSLLAIGITCMALADMGAAPWDLLAISLSQITFLTVGQWQIGLNIIMVVVVSLFLTHKIDLTSLIPGVILGFMIDFFMKPLEVFTFSPIILLTVGIFASGAGITLYINQKFVANAIDNFTYQLHRKYKITLDIAKVLTDFIAVIVILLFFRQYLTIVTLIIYITIPISIKGWSKIYRTLNII